MFVVVGVGCDVMSRSAVTSVRAQTGQAGAGEQQETAMFSPSDREVRRLTPTRSSQRLRKQVRFVARRQQAEEGLANQM